MKTITLTDEAYERLKSWKREPRESFSQVVLRAVPRRGTLAALSEAMDRLPPLTEDQATTMAEAIRDANDWKKHGDPWAS